MSDFHSLAEIAQMMPTLAPPPDDGPPEPMDDAAIDGPPDPGEEQPEEPPQEAPATAVRVPDEVLDPEQLVPAGAILARVETLPAVVAANARSQELVAAAAAFPRIVTQDDRIRADGLRDDLKAQEAAIDTFIGGACEAANKLHKGFTGLRAWMKGDLAVAAKRLGDGIAASIRAEQEAEAARQRAEREKALTAERARLKAEADSAELERQRLAAAATEALQSGDDTAAEQLQHRADEEARIAEQARQEAAIATAPPVAAQDVAKPAGASTRDNWQALPEHAETRDDLPLKDKTALLVFIGQRLAAGDGQFIHLVDVNWKACNQLAKAQQSTMKVPGLRAVNPPVYAKTRKG